MGQLKSEMGRCHFALLVFFALVACCFISCREKPYNPNSNLSVDYYASLSNPSFQYSNSQVMRELRRMAYADSDSVLADYYTRSHYLKHRSLVWIDRKGVDSRADSVLARLRLVGSMGFNPSKFRIPQIESDLQRLRRLDFDGRDNRLGKVLARLEYNLTKAYFRFAAGQYFGYTNPNELLNRLDRRETGTPYTSYYTLYGLDSPRQKSWFYATALRKVRNDSAAVFLDGLATRSPLYKRLKNILNSGDCQRYGRRLLLVNMERCRWRMGDYPYEHKKYVISNIPSFRLRAVDGDKILLMRMGCGSQKTKTPLLHSYIKRMDINPQWIMPRSIIKKSIIPRLGNRWYFSSHHYFVRNRTTGKNVDISSVTPSMLESGECLVIQEGGQGNALGRIIFRFDNDFSIYLHDTSSRSFFENDERDVSHGCIRVEKPFELAGFLLGDGDGRLKQRIRYSMNADVSPLGKKRDEMTEEQQAVADTLRRDMLIGKAEVKPRVPLFIVYFTLFPDADGTLRTFKDIYGYDDVLYGYLRNYL